MLISDWRSDVCSSDLEAVELLLVVEAELDDVGLRVVRRAAGEVITVVLTPGDGGAVRILGVVRRVGNAEAEAGEMRREVGDLLTVRSEERRVGQECVSTCRSGLSRYQ